MYEVVRVGLNQDVARVVNQFASQKEMRLITSVSRGTGVELIFGPVERAVDTPVGETTAESIQAALRARNADQERYDANVARERSADDERKRRADVLIGAMASTEMEALRARAIDSLPLLCRGKEVLVASRMRDLALPERQ
jgi:hypothetical protein